MAYGDVSAPAADATAPLTPTETVTANPDGTLSVSGTGEPGAEVSVTFPDKTVGTAVVAADGSFGPVTSAMPKSSTRKSSACSATPAPWTAQCSFLSSG